MWLPWSQGSCGSAGLQPVVLLAPTCFQTASQHPAKRLAAVPAPSPALPAPGKRLYPSVWSSGCRNELSVRFRGTKGEEHLRPGPICRTGSEQSEVPMTGFDWLHFPGRTGYSPLPVVQICLYSYLKVIKLRFHEPQHCYKCC